MIRPEAFVRPYQTKDLSPPRVQPATAEEQQVENVVLIFGANGAGKPGHGSSSFNRTKYMDKTPKEKVGGGSVQAVTFPPINFP